MRAGCPRSQKDSVFNFDDAAKDVFNFRPAVHVAVIVGDLHFVAPDGGDKVREKAAAHATKYGVANSQVVH